MKRTNLLNLVALVLVIVIVGVFAAITLSGTSQDGAATPTPEATVTLLATQTAPATKTPSPSPTATATLTLEPSPTLSGTSLMVINYTGQSLCVLNIAPSPKGEAGEWGANLLAESPLDHSMQASFPLQSGTYDLYAETCEEHATFVERYGEVIEGNVEWTLWYDPTLQWASSATASSQYGTDAWSASQATGQPDTADICGDVPAAWASASANEVATLTLTYDTPVIPIDIWVYQNYNPGAITRVEVIDLERNRYTVFEAAPQIVDAESCPAALNIHIADVKVPINQIVITVDQTNHPGWAEIDAVALQGIP